MRFLITSTYEMWDKYIDILLPYQYEEKKGQYVTNRYITVNTLDDLLTISKLTNREIIVGNINNENPYLEIYDGYRE